MRTTDPIRVRVTRLIDSWQTWAQPEAADGPMSTTQAMTHGEFEAHGTKAQSILEIARSIQNDPAYVEWSKLPENADHVADLQDIVDGMNGAVAHFLARAHHEDIWNRLDPREKQRITRNTRVDPDVVKEVNAHVQLARLPKK